MTLIVAKRFRDCTIAVSDTKLTPHSNANWQWSDQANKIVCLGDDWAVAFAGNSHIADTALKSLPRNPQFSDLKGILLESHIESLAFDPTDFLLFSARTQSIHKIANGWCREQPGNTAWIGDSAGYSVFQEHFHARAGGERESSEDHVSFEPGKMGIHPQIIDAEVDQFHTRLSNSLRAVISDEEITSVGGVPLTFVLAKGRQMFWPVISGLLVSPEPVIQGSEHRHPMFGEAQTGDFNYEIMVSREPSDNVVALYYRNARTALVFSRWKGGISSGRNFVGIEYEDVNWRVSDECGVSLWRLRIERISDGAYAFSGEGPIRWKS